MEFAVMQSAEGDRELVADLATERADLSEAQVVRVARLSPANEAGPRSDELDVGLVAVAPDLGNAKNALVDPAGASPSYLTSGRARGRTRWRGMFGVVGTAFLARARQREL